MLLIKILSHIYIYVVFVNCYLWGYDEAKYANNLANNLYIVLKVLEIVSIIYVILSFYYVILYFYYVIVLY